MKRSKIFIGASALGLAIAGFFTTKARADYKFFSFSGQIINASATGTLTLSSDLYTTTQGSNKTVILVTAATNTKLGTIVTTGTTKVYRKVGT